MKIIKTVDAVNDGYTFITESYCKEWQKYCVIDEKVDIVYVTADTKKECENYILYNLGVYVVPEFYKSKVKSFWRRKWER